MKFSQIAIMASLLTAGALAVPLTVSAETQEIRVLVDTAPPPVKESNPPMPSKAGYVWSQGYWGWNGSTYVWTEGSWLAVAEPSKKWVAPTWTQQGTKWYFTAGHWVSN